MLTIIRNTIAAHSQAKARRELLSTANLLLSDSLIFARGGDYAAARDILRKALACANRAGARHTAGKIMVAMSACKRAA